MTINDFGYEEEVTDDNMYAVAGDDYSGGAETVERHVAIQWFTGIKTPIVLSMKDGVAKYDVNSEGDRRAAKGMAIPMQWTKNDPLLVSVIKKLVKEKKATLLMIEHSGDEKKKEKSREEYCFLSDWSFVPLSLNAINHRVAISKPQMISGYATGVTIDEKTAYKGTYLSMLIIVRALHEAGYVNEDGSPKPLLCSMKSYNAADINKIMQGAVKRQKVWRELDAPGLNALRGKRDGKNVRGGEELFEYWIRLTTSTERVDRGKEPDVTSCFVAVDQDADPASWTPELEKALWVCEEMFKALFPLVYEIKDGKRVPGGISKDFATKTLARHSEICNRLDPEGKLLRMGENEVPIQWKLMEEAGRMKSLTAAVQLEPEVTPQQAAAVRYQQQITTYKEMLFGDEEGWRLVDEAQKQLDDTSPGRGARVGAAMQALKDYSNAMSDF